MYSITYNRARNLFMVWKTVGNTSEVVKTFKTEAAAQRWIQKHN